MPRDPKDLEKLVDELLRRLETLERGTASTDRDTDRKLTFATHINAQQSEVTVYGDDTDIDIRLNPERIKARPYGVLCVEVRNLDNPESPGSLGGSVPWCYRAPTSGVGYARILNFPGLDAATRYLVRFLILGG